MTRRAELDRTAGEREMLTRMLDWYRATLLGKIDGLSDAQARERAVPPSDLNLLGLLRHLADVERSWFRIRFAGEDLPPLYYDEAHPTGDPDGDLHPGPEDTVAQARTTWETEVDAARAITAAAGLDDRARAPGPGRAPFVLRWVLVHLIEEYARHVGHADLLRERIDGTTGH